MARKKRRPIGDQLMVSQKQNLKPQSCDMLHMICCDDLPSQVHNVSGFSGHGGPSD